jgi:signal transduction histidine kinase
MSPRVDDTGSSPAYRGHMRVQIPRSELPPLAVDMALGATLAVLQLADNLGSLGWWTALEGSALLCLSLRRRTPLLALSAMGALFAIGSVANVPAEGHFLPLLAGLLIAAYSAAAFEPSLTRSAVALAVLMAGVNLDLVVHGLPEDENVVFRFAELGVAWLVGRAIRRRRVEADVLADHARRLAVEEKARAAQAVADERARLARELHDVIAHNVSVMVVQAEAAEQILKSDPDLATPPLRSIQTAGRQTIVELRRLLGILRDGDDELLTTPQPALGQLDALVAQVEQAGLPTRLSIAGTPRKLPTSLDLSAYRIVQEALTNALKHAGAAGAEVAIRYRLDALEIEIIDDGRGRSGNGHVGHGLIGMRERVALFSGTFDARNRSDGGFIVRAVLPLEADE